MFEKVLGTKTLLMGFGFDSDAIHSPNEHFGIDNFLKGIETITLFYTHYSVLHKNIKLVLSKKRSEAIPSVKNFAFGNF